MENKINHEINDAVPQVLEHFIGQKQVVDRVKVMLEAAWNDGIRAPHCLMTGGPGLGKTELAHIIAKEMGSELRETLAQNLKTPEDLNGFLMDSADKDVLLIDEIHELSATVQTSLYRAMENGIIFINGAKRPTPLKLPAISVCGCTTDAFRLLPPLVDRFKLVLPFEFYTDDELKILVKNRCKQLGWQVQDEVISMVAANGRGTPRVALRLLSSIRLTARAENASVLIVDHAKRTFELEGIRPLAIGPDEFKYLRILAEHKNGLRLNIIASRIGLHQRTVSQVIESYLIRIGLLTKLHNGGRQLTPIGLEYVKTHLEGN